MKSRKMIGTVPAMFCLPAITLMLSTPAAAQRLAGTAGFAAPFPALLATCRAEVAWQLRFADVDDGAAQPSEEPVKAVVILGTIVRSGSDFALKDSNGNSYVLDAPDQAAPYEGKYVKVTGTLDEDAKLLHVDNIQEVSA